MTQAATISKYTQCSQVCARYGRTKMTIHRWIKDPELKFPKPIKIRNHLYFVTAELDAYDAAMEGER